MQVVLCSQILLSVLFQLQVAREAMVVLAVSVEQKVQQVHLVLQQQVEQEVQLQLLVLMLEVLSEVIRV
jgi:hypothetical protein